MKQGGTTHKKRGKTKKGGKQKKRVKKKPKRRGRAPCLYEWRKKVTCKKRGKKWDLRSREPKEKQWKNGKMENYKMKIISNK